MDMAVDAASGHNQVLGGDHFSGSAHDQVPVDAAHGVRVSRFADFHDSAVADSDVSLNDAPVIDDERVGDHQIERAVGSRRAGTLAHSVANHFPAAEGYF